MTTAVGPDDGTAPSRSVLQRRRAKQKAETGDDAPSKSGRSGIQSTAYLPESHGNLQHGERVSGRPPEPISLRA